MNHDHSQGGMGKHMLLMIICCAVPILLVTAVSLFGLSLGPLQWLVPYVAALMCPLMMIGMMWMMMRDHRGDQSQHHTNPSHGESKTLPSLAVSNSTATSTVSPQDSCH